MVAFYARTILSLALFASFGHAVKVSIPLLSAPTTPKVSSSLISLSIEMDRWTDWAGTASRNTFFYNTLDNLKQITGQPLQIRIGANSEDRTNFNKNVQFAQIVYPPSSLVYPYPEAQNITVGDSYYATARFLPPNTRVIWGVNLGENNITAAVLETQSIVKAFSSPEIRAAGIVLEYLEIGNEPDFYKNNGFRPSNYTVARWVNEWKEFAQHVSVAGGLNAASPHTKFLGASFAVSSHNFTNFSPQSAFQAGLLTGPGKRIPTISQHHYSGSFCAASSGLLSDLMTKSTIRGNLTAFVPDIKATFAQGLDYILGETNSYACHGAPGVSNTAGAALWTLDYALFASQLKISTVFFHNGVGYKYSLIQPIALTRSIQDGSALPSPVPAHVQPQYYAAIIAAEAIGKTGSAQVLELQIDHPQIAGYAFYEGGALVRAVFINSKAYLPESKTRTSVHLNLGFTAKATYHSAPTSVKVKRLAIQHATDVAGLTWGGQTYETADGRVSGTEHQETRAINRGVDIAETEVVLLTFF